MTETGRPDWGKFDEFWRARDEYMAPLRETVARNRLAHYGVDEAVKHLFKHLTRGRLRQIFQESSFADLVAERVRQRLAELRGVKNVDR